jgi:hypothetical protein
MIKMASGVGMLNHLPYFVLQPSPGLFVFMEEL